MAPAGDGARVPLVRASNLTLADVASVLDAELLTGPGGAIAVHAVFSADLLSDVLALGTPGMLLLTGLVNVQTIRTAQIADLAGVVFVRAKPVDENVLAQARDAGVTLMRTRLTLFEASGRLYAELQRRATDRPAGHG